MTALSEEQTIERRRRWYVPDAYIPTQSSDIEESHESVCILNDGGDATIRLTAFFADREPEVSDPIALAARRAVHLRTTRPADVGGLRLERGVPYGLVIESASDLHVQYSRLDTTHGAYTLMTAIPEASYQA